MVDTGQTAQERRAKRRVTVRMEVIRSGTPSVSFGIGGNISENGMKIESSQMHPPDSVIKVRFVLPSHPNAVMVEVQAKVVWRDSESSTGVRFLGLKDEDRKAIARFVEGN